MDKICEICGKTASYKCPRCYIYYCSVSCNKKHKNANCEDKRSSSKEQTNQENGERMKIGGSSTVPVEKLRLLDNSEELKNLLANKHLRDLLMIVDKAENAETIMQEAMLEPIFLEFADACLKVVDPKSDDD